MASVERHQRAEVEVGEDVAVDHHEGVVDPGGVGGEANRSGGVERRRLGGVGEPDACGHVVGVGILERVRQVLERQHRLVDAVRAEMLKHPLDHRPLDDRQHLFRGAEGQWSQAGALAPESPPRQPATPRPRDAIAR